MRLFVALIASSALSLAHADAPKEAAAFGVQLGASPNAAASILANRYPPCGAIESAYRELPAERTQYIAGLDINPGLTFNDLGAPDVCSYSPAGDGVTDSIEARFVHPDVERDQPLYQITATRVWPDVIYAPMPKLRNSFDEIRSELFRMYGKPIDERRESVASAAANLASSLGIGRNVKREDYRVRYLWATTGRLAAVEHEGTACDCGPRYVKAVIEISRSPSTMPKNRYYVSTMTLLVEDNGLRSRQEAWNAQAQGRSK